MKLMKTVGVLAVFAFFTSCAMFGPSEKPELKAEVDGVFSMTPKNNTYQNRGIIPWEVGQWILTRTVTGDGKRSIHRMSVVKKEGNRIWLENEIVDYYSRTRSAILVEGFNPNNLKGMKVIKAKIEQEDGNIIEWSAEEGENPFLSAVNASLATLQQVQSSSASEDVTTTAGTFKSTNKTAVNIEMTAVIIKVNATGTVWYTYAVPIMYYAKSDMESKTFLSSVKTTEEIVDFGFSGAKSYFFK